MLKESRSNFQIRQIFVEIWLRAVTLSFVVYFVNRFASLTDALGLRNFDLRKISVGERGDWRKEMKKSILFAFVILVAVAFGLSSCASKEMKKVRNMPINEVDLSDISDGSYKGDFSYGGFTYELEVTVKEHRIENIEILKNRDTKHAKKAECPIFESRRSYRRYHNQ
jgi:uncharacterized protein with FMN-binding domain